MEKSKTKSDGNSVTTRAFPRGPFASALVSMEDEERYNLLDKLRGLSDGYRISVNLACRPVYDWNPQYRGLPGRIAARELREQFYGPISDFINTEIVEQWRLLEAGAGNEASVRLISALEALWDTASLDIGDLESVADNGVSSNENKKKTKKGPGGASRRKMEAVEKYRSEAGSLGLVITTVRKPRPKWEDSAKVIGKAIETAGGSPVSPKTLSKVFREENTDVNWDDTKGTGCWRATWE